MFGKIYPQYAQTSANGFYVTVRFTRQACLSMKPPVDGKTVGYLMHVDTIYNELYASEGIAASLPNIKDMRLDRIMSWGTMVDQAIFDDGADFSNTLILVFVKK